MAQRDYWDHIGAGLCGWNGVEGKPVPLCRRKATHNVSVTGERDDGEPTCPKHLALTVLLVLDFDYPTAQGGQEHQDKATSVTVRRVGQNDVMESDT